MPPSRERVLEHVRGCAVLLLLAGIDTTWSAIGSSIWHLAIHPDDLENTRNEMRLARSGQRMRNFECRYVHKDGHVVPLAWTGVWSEPDQQHFFIGRDMTERIRLEQQLRQALAASVHPAGSRCGAALPERRLEEGDGAIPGHEPGERPCRPP